MDFRIAGREFNRAPELLLRRRPVPIPKECNLGQGCMRFAHSLIKVERPSCCVSSFRKCLCGWQTDFAEGVRLGKSGIGLGIMRILRNRLFKILASQVRSIFGKLVQVESSLKIEFMRLWIFGVVFSESRPFIFS